MVLQFIQTLTLFTWDVDIFFNVFPKPYLCPCPCYHLSSPKLQTCLKILIRYHFLTSTSLSFLKLNLSTTKFCAAYHITNKIGLAYFCEDFKV